MRFSTLTLAVCLAASAAPALAQDAAEPTPAITVTGAVTGITDYRFRGLTQTNEDPAIQGTINVNHSSGLYVGTWASSIDGGCDGSTPALTCYGGAEVDLYGGFTKTLPSGFGFDVGLLYYYYPGGSKGVNTDFFEPYASVNYTAGPANVKVGGNYAWGGQKGLNFTAGNDDSLYLYGELAVTVPSTPVTLKGHLGFSNGSLGLANPTLADDTYTDYSLTAEVAKGPIKGGISYVDTNITNRTVAGVGRFANALGRDATVLGYLTFSF